MTALGQINTTTDIGSAAYSNALGVGNVFFLTGNLSDLTETQSSAASQQLNATHPGSTSTGTATFSSGSTNHLSWATPLGFPGVVTIPAARFKFYISIKQTTGTRTFTSAIKLYKQTSGGTQTLLGTTNSTSNLTGSYVVYELYMDNIGPTTLGATDRLVAIIVHTGSVSGTDGSISVQVGNTAPAERLEISFVAPFLRARELLTGARTYYVRTDGSDSNTGLANSATGAFLTLQKAINVVYGTLDLYGNNVTIQVGNGTYTTGVLVDSPQVGKGTITLQGDTTTPSNVVISTTSADAIKVMGQAVISVKGFKLVTATSGFGILCRDSGVTFITGKMEYGACASGHILSQTAQIISESISYTISGNAPYHIRASLTGFISVFGCTVTLTGTPAFSTAYAQVLAGVIVASSNSWTNTATGTRYDATLNGVINTGGGGANYFPGNAGGTTATGGQYA